MVILEQSMHSSAWKVDSPKLALTEFSGVRRFFGALTCFVPWRTYIPFGRKYAAYIAWHSLRRVKGQGRYLPSF
jgi:hypothetical protein